MKYLVNNYNGIMDCFLPFIQKTTNLLDADKVIVWNDLVQPEKQIVEMAKEYGKESTVIEHGMKAVSDYQKDLKDIYTGMGGKPFIANKICVWGNKSKQIMLDAGVSEERIFVVGSPIIWEHEYKYICEAKKDQRILRGFIGMKVKDPTDEKLWEFAGHRSWIPQNKSKEITIFFPHHDYTAYAREQNKLIWDKVKFRDDIFIKLPQSYNNEEDQNPFKEIVKMKPEERKKICAVADTKTGLSNHINRKLLERAKAAVIVAPGTINGVCWSLDVPTIVPKIDYFWRINGEIVYDIHKADYECDKGGVNEKVEEILKKDTKAKEREEYAREFMGTDAGNPRDNIIKAIK